MASEADGGVQFEALQRLQPAEELLHRRIQHAHAEFLRRDSERQVSNRTARLFAQSDGAVVIALNQPVRRECFHRPLHALGGLRAVVDQIAKAQNLIGVRLGLQHGLKRRPVAVDVGEEQNFHDSLPIYLCLVGVISPEAVSARAARQTPLPAQKIIATQLKARRAMRQQWGR